MLSDLHKADNLKEATASFIRKAFADVKKTDGWKNLMASSRPEFLSEIFESVLLSVWSHNVVAQILNMENHFDSFGKITESFSRSSFLMFWRVEFTDDRLYPENVQ